VPLEQVSYFLGVHWGLSPWFEQEAHAPVNIHTSEVGLMLYPALWGDERASRDTAMLYTKPSPRMLLSAVGVNPVAFLAEGRTSH
jgi:hypothetical protein